MALSELYHNTAEQVSQYVEGALSIATADDVPDELRAVVFVEAIHLLAAKTMLGSPDILPAHGLIRGH